MIAHAYSTAKLRRAYFALCRTLGLDEDDRHAFNEALTGFRSSGDFSRDDWRKVVAQLQRDAGQDAAEGVPRLKAERRPGDTLPGEWATREQAGFIRDLCGRIEWWKGGGPVAYVCRHFLAGPENALRRRTLSEAPEEERWLRLTRREASGVVKALRKMSVTYRRATADV